MGDDRCCATTSAYSKPALCCNYESAPRIYYWWVSTVLLMRNAEVLPACLLKAGACSKTVAARTLIHISVCFENALYYSSKTYCYCRGIFRMKSMRTLYKFALCRIEGT